MTPWHDPTFLTFCQVLLAATFGLAGWSKLRRLDEFAGIVRNFRVLPAVTAEPAARALPVVELALAAALIVGPFRHHAALVALALLAAFTAAIAVNLLRGRRNIDCGCFRAGANQPLNGWLVARNLLLMAAATMLAAAPAGPWLPGWLELLTALLATTVTLLLYMAASFLPTIQPASGTPHHHHEAHSP